MSLRAARPVVVLMGGRSGEREVSLGSGAAVLAALASSGPRAVQPVEITGDGRWRWETGEGNPAEALAALPACAVFFLALHGGEGEDGTLQGLLSACGRTYTGSGVGASALCMDKAATRGVLAEAGLAVAPGVRTSPREWDAHGGAVLDRLQSMEAAGWFVKPNAGGSSLGVRRIVEADELGAAITALLADGEAVLVEALVEGCEASCPVLGNPGGPLRALDPVEIVPSAAGFFDYTEKYDERGGAREIVPPTGLSRATCERLRELALRAHEVTGCAGTSRTDFIVPKTDASEGEPVVLEVNTLPGLTPRSLLPQSAAAGGLGFAELCEELVALAIACEERR
ncbi:MAG: D-alanine--D-alanine ligase [Planctomycetota bacterium]|jgi:D-alanine-D-alanine ligase|nr:D-alanine--D-alanine ligase [Planctomycetota bacterium]